MSKKQIRFEWDWGNVAHLWERHQVRPFEAEEAMKELNAIKGPDESHSQTEVRFSVIGKTLKARILFLVFTLRNGRIRVLHARDTKRKEVKIYEEKISSAKIQKRRGRT